MEQRSDPVIFINYRRSDAGWPADRLAERLRTAFGNDRVFLDVRSIETGEDFTEEIKSRLERATVLLVLIGKRWLFVQDEHGRRRLDNRNDWVRREIRTVLGRKNSKVIPVLLDDAELPREKKALPGDISSLLRRQRISIRQAESERDIDQLIYEIEKSGFERLADSTSQGAGTPRPVPREARDIIKPKVYCVSTGPLTLGAILKGSPPRTVGDAYPTGKSGVHFVFDLFNGNAFDFLVSKIVVEVFAYENLALGELTHGVGATEVKRFYHAKINRELGRYSASYLENRPGEYVKILANEAEKFDVEITTATEGLYSVRLHLSGGAGGEAFDFLLDGTERQIVFFDRNAGYLIDRGHGIHEKKLSWSQYIKDVGIKGF
jgi:hypothetical protein